MYNFKFIFIIVLFSSSKKVENCPYMEIYIAPQNSECGYTGPCSIYKYPLNKKSIKVKFEDKDYFTIIEMDSVCQLLYVKSYIDNLFVDSVFSDFEVDTMRAYDIDKIIIKFYHINRKMKKDIFIDDFLLVKVGKKQFRNKYLVKYILDIMPVELRESWNFVYPITYN